MLQLVITTITINVIPGRALIPVVPGLVVVERVLIGILVPSNVK
jgi:hypothetical protein